STLISVSIFVFFFSSRRRHTRSYGDWSSDVCSSDLGATNTGVLICSSLTMVLAVQSAQMGERKKLMIFLVLTMFLGATFLTIKRSEERRVGKECRSRRCRWC